MKGGGAVPAVVQETEAKTHSQHSLSSSLLHDDLMNEEALLVVIHNQEAKK